MSMIEEVAEIKREQEAQRGDLVRINNSIKELSEALQGTTAALNNLSVKYDRLMNDIQKAPAPSNDGLTQEQVRAVIAEELKGLQQDGASVFAPLRDKAAELSQEFTAAGKVAAKQIREAGKPDWTEVLVRGLVTALWYVCITGGVMYWLYGIKDIHSDLAYLRDRVDAIQYNQTIPGANFSPWDMKAFHEAWDNQNEYIGIMRQNNIKGK